MNMKPAWLAKIFKELIKYVPPEYSCPIVPFADHSFAQEGEDMILRTILLEGRPERKGFYVDVGCHHAQRFSNTYYFYLRGWNGINIDPVPGTKELFDRIRPRDFNLELAIGADNRTRTFYELNEKALSTFSEDQARKCIESNSQYKIVASHSIQARRLDEVLSNFPRAIAQIDFLSVDVEGMDLEVLQSNDWSRWMPTVIAVENLNMSSVFDHAKSETGSYLSALGYKLVACTPRTGIFKKSDC